jgi:hypothetical protein
MTNEGNSRIAYQYWDCASTISEVDIDPAYRKTPTKDSPIATS